MRYSEKIVRGLDGNYNKGEDKFQQELKLRKMQYGHFPIGEVRGNVLCSLCGIELNGTHTLINKVPFCRSCLGKQVASH
jgi:hypothetical protein